MHGDANSPRRRSVVAACAGGGARAGAATKEGLSAAFHSQGEVIRFVGRVAIEVRYPVPEDCVIPARLALEGDSGFRALSTGPCMTNGLVRRTGRSRPAREERAAHRQGVLLSDETKAREVKIVGMIVPRQGGTLARCSPMCQ